MRLSVLLLSGLAAIATMAQATPAPKVQATSFEQLAKPLPLPYDEGADAKAVVAKAKAKARASGKLLLIDLGGNWCLDCRILAGTVELPDLKPFVEKHYVEAVVDVGRFDKNLDIPAHYGFTKRLAGVPAVLIVDPKTDK